MSDTNEERQENEILALKSIYDERQFVLPCEGHGGTLAAYVELPEDFKVAYPSIKLRIDGELSIPNGEESHYEEINIQCLPPIILYFELPENYPSDAPPPFTLTCKWLTVMQLTKLCKQLDAIWQEEGCEVLFTWMQFLTDQTLSFLKILSSMCLETSSTDEQNYGYDQRANQDIASIDDLVNFIIEYDSQESTRQFNTPYYSCGVCFIEKLGTYCIKFPQCKHIYCSECVCNYFEIQIRDGAVRSLSCPDGECEVQAEPSLVKRIVSEKMYMQYEKFLLQSTLDCMKDVTYCPRNACQNVVLLELGSEMLGRCPVCSFVFCVSCKRSYHGVTNCYNTKKPTNITINVPTNIDTGCPTTAFEEEYLDNVFVSEVYISGSVQRRAELEKRYDKGWKLQKDVIAQEFYSEAVVESLTQACPSCTTRIEKNAGCNHMRCSRCKCDFCWVCCQVYPCQCN